MDNNTLRVVISQLIRLKDINRDEVINMLLQYLGNGYELEKIVSDILDMSVETKVRGL